MKISVVTISYNQGIFLEEAINSVLSQSYNNIEYIVIDAGSTDNSRDIITKYSSELATSVFESDKGPADGLNKGLALCTGDIFCYLNADDLFLPGAFFYVIDHFTKYPKIDGLLGAADIIDDQGNKKLRRRLSHNYNIEGILNGTAIALQQSTFLNMNTIRAKISVLTPRIKPVGTGNCLSKCYLMDVSFSAQTKLLGNSGYIQAQLQVQIKIVASIYLTDKEYERRY